MQTPSNWTYWGSSAVNKLDNKAGVGEIAGRYATAQTLVPEPCRKRLLATGKIRALSFEFGSRNINSRTFFRDYWELLTAANFAIYRIAPCGKDILVEDYYEDAEYFRGVSNFVAELKK